MYQLDLRRHFIIPRSESRNFASVILRINVDRGQFQNDFLRIKFKVCRRCLLRYVRIDSEWYCLSEKTQGVEQDATQRDPKCHSQSPEATDYVTSPIAILSIFRNLISCGKAAALAPCWFIVRPCPELNVLLIQTTYCRVLAVSGGTWGLRPFGMVWSKREMRATVNSGVLGSLG